MARDLDLVFDIATGELTFGRLAGNYVKRSETLTISVTIVSDGASATIPSGLIGTLKPVNVYNNTLAQWNTFSQVGSTNVYTSSATLNAAAITTLLGTTSDFWNCVFDFAGSGVVESDTLAIVLKNNVTRDDDTAPTALLNRNDFLVSNGTGLLINVSAGYSANGAFVAAQSGVVITNATNYIEADADGVATVNTTGFTAGKAPLAKVIATAGAITSNTDLRPWITLKPSTSSGGLTINTTTVSGASAGDILTSDGTKLQKLTLGDNVASVLANPVSQAGGTILLVDDLASYAGSTGINTLGTVTTGTWSAATIAVNKGGIHRRPNPHRKHDRKHAHEGNADRNRESGCCHERRRHHHAFNSAGHRHFKRAYFCRNQFHRHWRGLHRRQRDQAGDREKHLRPIVRRIC